MTDFERLFEAKINEIVTPLKKEVETLKKMLGSQIQKEYLSAKEVKDFYGISRTTLNRYCANGRLNKYYLGDAKTLFSRTELDSLVFKA